MPRPLFDERTKMLWRVGFIQPLDLLAAFVFASGTLVLVFWRVFGQPNVGQLAFWLALLAIWLLLWLIVLVFRCSWFVLQLLAEQKNLPAAAARLVFQFSRTGNMPTTAAAP